MYQYVARKLEDPKYPLLGPNIKLLKIHGLILPKNSMKKWLYIFLHLTVIAFGASEYAEMWFLKDDINLLLTNMKVTILATVSICKVISFLIWAEKWLELMNYVTRADKIQRDSYANENIIKSYTKYSRKITCFYWILMYSTVLTIISQPICKYAFSETYRLDIRDGTEEYAQVISSWVPFDKTTILGNICACIYQSYSAVFGGGWIIAFDTNAIVIMVFFVGELKMLKADSAKLFGLGDSILSKDEFKIRLKSCHKRHVELLKFCRLFNTCLSPIMFLYVIVCSVMICATAYQINIETNTIQRIITAVYLIFGLTQLFMYCWHCNEVYFVSNQLSLGPYKSSWWARDLSEQKDVIILTGQFKKTIIFSAGPFTNVTVATLISILKGAYSYYTLLNQTNQE